MGRLCSRRHGQSAGSAAHSWPCGDPIALVLDCPTAFDIFNVVRLSVMVVRRLSAQRVL